MIQAAVQHLANQLAQFVRRRHGSTEEMVLASTLVQPDGSPVPQAQNRLVLTLVKIEKDSVPRPAQGRFPESDGRSGIRTTPLHLNLHVLLAANFAAGSYSESLKYLSSGISFFQRNPIFDHGTSPDLPNGIERLVLEIENASIQELSNLWGMLGAKHVPSILYKVRLVTMGGSELAALVPEIANGMPRLGKKED